MNELSEAARTPKFTTAESVVATALLEGQMTAEIAAENEWEIRTTEALITKIRKKLGLSPDNRSRSAVVMALLSLSPDFGRLRSAVKELIVARDSNAQ